jgi:beta-lactamase superfamily II metal-dependent hydrolase
MKNPNRLLSLLLALLVVAAMCISCVNNGNTAETTDANGSTTSTEETSQQKANDLKIIADNTSYCSVVRPEKYSSTSMAVTCATDIRAAIGSATGTTPKIIDDWTRDGTHDENAIEILVGQTNYSESAAVLSSISYGEYMIKIIGNKLVVAAYTDSALRIAANKLINLIKSLSKDGSLTIPADTLVTDTVDKDLAALPSYDGGTFSATYDCGNGATEIIIKNTNSNEYQNYLAKLEANGYTAYTTSTMADNLFATYDSSKYTVNAGFYKYENSTRIIIESLAKHVGLESENVYTAVTTSQITMFGLEYTDSSGSTVSNGLSVLIRLTDGRFVIIDGGFNTAACATNLINAMKEQSASYIKSGQKITIAAWIVTHAHGDHTGMISKRYSSFASFKVEKFLVNFMSESERQKAISTYPDNWDSGEGGGYTDVLTAAAALKADVLWVHVGQVIYLADLKIEVLYTIESFAPQVCNAFNGTSVVMKMTFGDGTVYMSTGDATGNALQICARMYGSYLKSDIVQVSHHGYSTWGNDSGTALAYKLMLPATVLWPQGLTAYPNYQTKSYNVVLFSPEYISGGENPNFKEIYIAGTQGDYITIPIPYSVGNAIVSRKK